MPRYIISNPTSGLELGTYYAKSEQEALDLWAQDAGYKDQADADREVGPVNLTCDELYELSEGPYVMIGGVGHYLELGILKIHRAMKAAKVRVRQVWQQRDGRLFQTGEMIRTQPEWFSVAGYKALCQRMDW